jgi:hypothetical protein
MGADKEKSQLTENQTYSPFGTSYPTFGVPAFFFQICPLRVWAREGEKARETEYLVY